MHHRMGRSLYRLKGLSDDMLPCLGQHLDSDVIGNHVPLNKGADKVVLGIGGSRKTYLDLLETDFYQ